MITQLCAICEKNNYSVIYPENFDSKKIDERIFSARRLPDRIHYRLVKCNACGLIYSNPILEYKKIEKLYRKSFTAYDQQLDNLKETYGYYLEKLKKYIVVNRHACSLLEIGCGNGFFLEEAQKQRFRVWGVEPGKKSVEKANPKIKKNIIIDIFRPKLFRKNFFDVICSFQTLDHIPNPNEFLAGCYKILKKGGFALFLNHDVEALPNRLMGEKSPIIDIEHTYLFGKKTMKKIFEKHKFEILELAAAENIHNLSYWIHLFPLAKLIKSTVIKLLDISGLGLIKVKLRPGNLYLIAKK